MAIDRDDAFEFDSGLLFSGAAHVSSGSAVPTHSADNGDWYLRIGTTPELYWRESGSWVLKAFGGDAVLPDFVLTDELGHVWTDDLCPVILG